METKVYTIKPHVRAKFSGISSLPKTRTVYTGAQMDANGLYKTGLTEEEEKKFEKELNLPANTLSKTNKAFWSNLELRLNNDKATKFAVSNAMDIIRFKALVERSNVAKNLLEVKNNPVVEFYVEDQEAIAEVVNLEADIKMEALDKFQDTTSEQKKGILKVLEFAKKTPMKGIDNLSDKIIKTTLFKNIEENAKAFLDIVNDPNLDTRILIAELLEEGKLTKTKHYYNYAGEQVGSSMDEVIEFFNDSRRQSIRIAAKQEIKNTKKAKE